MKYEDESLPCKPEKRQSIRKMLKYLCFFRLLCKSIVEYRKITRSCTSRLIYHHAIEMREFIEKSYLSFAARIDVIFGEFALKSNFSHVLLAKLQISYLPETKKFILLVLQFNWKILRELKRK